jgi:flagellar hook protein FlgE
MISSKIIKHGNYVETITAKSTDYSATAKSDSSTVFSGAGLKTKGAKESDIEAAIKDYTNWLKKLQDEPDGVSAASVPQVTQINFKTGTNGIISKDSDQIYVYINGNKISQNYVVTSATAADKTALDAITPAVTTGWTSTDYDRAMSRISTYKALADKISGIAGLVAYTSSETGGGNDDVLEMSDTFAPSTKLADMYKGIIQIKSLIPGTEFTISEVAEVSSNTTNQGNYLTTTTAKAGSGTGALESSREALSKLITGKQQDVYTMADLITAPATFPATFTYSIDIYDKDLGKSIPVPNDNATVPTAVPISITGATSIDDFITKFNIAAAAPTSTPKLTNYVEAVNINGNLVIRTKDKNFDVEFSGALKNAGTPKDKNAGYSGRAGAGAEFIEIVNKVDQTASKNSLQLRLDTLGISDTAFGEFAVDSTGLITMKQDGADFAIGQVAIALFNNNQGLNPMGDNLLAKTNESGDPIYNLNNNKTAKIEGKTLELSKADLSESLVNLMVFQRAFEANAKSITTSDEILTTLIGLKR